MSKHQPKPRADTYPIVPAKMLSSP